MARGRQSSKERQAERRARRLAEQQGAPADGPSPAGVEAQAAGEQGPAAPRPDPTVVEPSPAVDPNLAVGAPPPELGRSDEAIADEPDLGDQGARDESQERELAVEGLEADVEGSEEAQAPLGSHGEAEAPATRRPRFVQFLFACWAELQRVQWPNRQTLVTLTGVVLGFVLIAGGYLGLLDAIVSRLIQVIL